MSALRKKKAIAVSNMKEVKGRGGGGGREIGLTFWSQITTLEAERAAQWQYIQRESLDVYCADQNR